MSNLPSLTAFVAVLCLVAACDSPSGPNPPAETVLPTISCPADLTVASESGGPIRVSYAAPSVTSAHPPASVACGPAPDTEFPLGVTPVTCTTVDSAGSASCAFRVDVTRTGRQLKYTKFLAFGDSQTEGFLRDPPDFTTAFRPLYISPTDNYPYYLEQMLRLRYGRDDIVVINEGLGGETVVQAQDRIVGALNRHKPDVLLLLHGYNRLTSISLEDARSAFRSIIRSAQVRDVDVALATLFYVSPARDEAHHGTNETIRDLNDRLRGLAGSLGLGGVADLEQAFGQDGAFLGSDGLHPTPAGYRRLAETFRDHVIERFEADPAPQPARRAIGPSP